MRTTCLTLALALAVASGCSDQSSPSDPVEPVDATALDDGTNPADASQTETTEEPETTGPDSASGCDDPNADFICDDGDLCTDDACDAETGACLFLPRVCDDGVFCNGVEGCDSELGCQPGDPPSLDDGVDCTVDVCDEEAESVTHTPDDAPCQDDLFCNGVEVCDLLAGCVSGDPPDASDGLDCTLDACDESSGGFTHLPLDSACDDGLVCNGLETCDADLGCQAGISPDADDGVPCTVDTCDDSQGGVLHTPDHAPCQDDVFCNGAESCDPSLGCQEAEAPETDDGIPCT
ncbi:MAG: hypothetical protein VYE15_01410, partial [Myxococcota bacterium]|nr:hypothetical protein [Myxococcota bacterium]